MVWLHAQMSALALSPKLPRTDFSPCFVPRKKTVWRQLHCFSFLPPQAMWCCTGSQVTSLPLSCSSLSASWSWHCIPQFWYQSQPGRHVKSNYLLLQGKGENERQIQVDPSVTQRWAKGTIRSQAGVKLLTKPVHSLSSYKKRKGKKKKGKRRGEEKGNEEKKKKKRKKASFITHTYKHRRGQIPFASHSVLFWVDTIGWYLGHIYWLPVHLLPAYTFHCIKSWDTKL